MKSWVFICELVFGFHQNFREMSNLSEKYTPNKLRKFEIHSDLANKFIQACQNTDFTHYLFYGPVSSGKKTLIQAVLTKLFGKKAIEATRLQTRIEKLGTDAPIKLSYLQSQHHIEFSVLDIEAHDRLVIQHLVQQLACSQTLLSAFQTSSTGAQLAEAMEEDTDADTDAEEEAELESPELEAPKSAPLVKLRPVMNFKVIVLYEADRLSLNAQQALRRTMEVYASNCRFILCTRHLSRIIHPLRSRCCTVRVPQPPEKEVESWSENIAIKELLPLSSGQIKNICIEAKYRLREILFDFELCKVQNEIQSLANAVKEESNEQQYKEIFDTLPSQLKAPLRVEQQVQIDLQQLIDFIWKDVNNKTAWLPVCRKKMKQVLDSMLSGDEILKLLLTTLMRRYGQAQDHGQGHARAAQWQLAQLAAECSLVMNQANTKLELVHLENFLLGCILNEKQRAIL